MKLVPWAKPGRMFQSAPSKLLFVDMNKKPRRVHWVHFNKQTWTKPDLCTFTQHREVSDMCVLIHQGREVLVASNCFSGVGAYNTNGSAEEWSASRYIPNMKRKAHALGITTDDCGNLFVCDKLNMCVQVLSTWELC